MKSEARITLAGTRVVLVLPDGRFADFPWQAAEQIGKALIEKAKTAEELESAHRVARDEAEARLIGLPFGLARTRKVSDEATRILKTDDKLRRYYPDGPKRGVVGTPGVYHKRED